MSTKTVLRVEVGFSTQTGVKWVEVRTAADYRHLVRNHGNPVGLRYWDDVVSYTQNRPSRPELPLSGAIPASKTTGLLSVKSGAGAPTGTDAAPMTFVVTNRHDGTNAIESRNEVFPQTLWGKMVVADDLPTYRSGGEQEGLSESIRQIIREATFRPNVQENVKIGYNGPNGTRWFICDTPRKYGRIVRFLGMPTHIRTVEPEPGKDYRAGAKGLIGERSTLIPRTLGITRKGTEDGHFYTSKTNVFVVDSRGEAVYSTHGRALRYEPAATWKDGTKKPEPDFYAIYGETRKNSPKVGRDDMNLATEEEMLEVRQMTRNLARARDLQRSRTRSDMGRVNDDSGRKPDGADMWDAMQDSVLYLVQGLKWAQTLTESSYSVETRTCDSWWYIPASIIRMAAEADITGEEVDVEAEARRVTRTGLKWTAARNSVRDHFTVQDAQARMFRAKMLVEGKEVEYEQVVDEGQPGTSWGSSLRTKTKGVGNGGTVARPQYVGIALLRTSSDNPYSAETFQSAVDILGGWDNLPNLREALDIGMNDARVLEGGRMGVISQMAANRNDGIMPSNRQVTNMSGQIRAEWDMLRETLDVVRDLTDRHNQYEQATAEQK